MEAPDILVLTARGACSAGPALLAVLQSLGRRGIATRDDSDTAIAALSAVDACVAALCAPDVVAGATAGTSGAPVPLPLQRACLPELAEAIDSIRRKRHALYGNQLRVAVRATMHSLVAAQMQLGLVPLPGGDSGGAAVPGWRMFSGVPSVAELGSLGID